MVTAWETGRQQHPLDRALTLLAAAHPERSREELATLTVGQRDALLLELRERMFGSRMQARVVCPRCGEAVELEVSTSQLRVGAPAAGAVPYELETDGIRLRFRLPDSRDLAAAVRAPDGERAHLTLVERCVIEARAANEAAPQPPAVLPPAVLGRLAQAMAELDPQAEVLLDLDCAACRHGWQAQLDIGTFLFSELTGECKRLLGEVHALALAYKWSEADILAMPPHRRSFYLAMVGYE
jgi:hypothetical protein